MGRSRWASAIASPSPRPGRPQRARSRPVPAPAPPRACLLPPAASLRRHLVPASQDRPWPACSASRPRTVSRRGARLRPDPVLMPSVHFPPCGPRCTPRARHGTRPERAEVHLPPARLPIPARPPRPRRLRCGCPCVQAPAASPSAFAARTPPPPPPRTPWCTSSRLSGESLPLAVAPAATRAGLRARGDGGPRSADLAGSLTGSQRVEQNSWSCRRSLRSARDGFVPRPCCREPRRASRRPDHRALRSG